MTTICPVCHSCKVKQLYPSTLDSWRLGYRITEKSIRQHGEIAHCQDCLLRFVDNPALVSELTQGYETNAVDVFYETEQAGRRKTNFKLLRRVSNFAPPPARLLDIGCYTGMFLRTAQLFGYQAYGLEPNIAAVAVARQGGLPNIVRGSLETNCVSWPDGFFDIVTAFDVIEHLADPYLLPEFAKDKLSAQGLLVISTPDAGCWLSRLQKESWHAVLPHHLFYFSAKSLAILLSDRGFRIIATSRLTRYFTLGYLVQVARQRNGVAGKLISWLRRFKSLTNRTAPVNLFDQIVVYAKKA